MGLNDKMTAIADAIRTKTGITEKLTLDEMAAAIMGILVDDGTGYTCGTVKPTTNNNAITVKHGLGQTPGAILFVKKGSTSSASSGESYMYEALVSIVYGPESGHSYAYHNYRTSSSPASTKYWTNSTTVPGIMWASGTNYNSYYVTNINETSFSTPSYLRASSTYVWVAFKAALI